jgi:hypothetical protein
VQLLVTSQGILSCEWSLTLFASVWPGAGIFTSTSAFASLSLSLSLSLMVGLTYDCARVSIVVSCHVSIDNPSPHGGRRQRERGNGVPANARPWRKTFGRSDTPLMWISWLRCTRLQPSGVDILGEGEGFLGVEGKFLSIGRHYFVGDADPRLDDATVANIYIYIYILYLLYIHIIHTYIHIIHTYIYIFISPRFSVPNRFSNRRSDPEHLFSSAAAHEGTREIAIGN